VILALKAYARAPELFSGMIFVGGLPEATAEAKARLIERAAFIRARGTMIGLGEAILPYLMAPESFKAMPGILGAMQRLVEINDPVGYAEACDALAQTSATDLVANVRVPCRLIVGSEDHYASPANVRAFAEKLPRHPSVIEFPHCGHFPFFEKPVEFHAAVKGFVES
jgi:pimeloyl-ACP methyl ester carboxylesterase